HRRRPREPRASRVAVALPPGTFAFPFAPYLLRSRSPGLCRAFCSTATGIRTPVSAVRGRRPSPLDDGGLETGKATNGSADRPGPLAQHDALPAVDRLVVAVGHQLTQQHPYARAVVAAEELRRLLRDADPGDRRHAGLDLRVLGQRDAGNVVMVSVIPVPAH